MERKRLTLVILSLLFIVAPFFINIYSIYKLLSLLLGIILLDVSFAMSKKVNIFLIIYLPILLLIFTYSIDYIKTYTLNVSPIVCFIEYMIEIMNIFLITNIKKTLLVKQI